jgi:hypothetical protein
MEMLEEEPSGPVKIIHVICPEGRSIADPPRLFVKGGEKIGIKSHCSGLLAFFPNPNVVDGMVVVDDVDKEWPEDAEQRPVDPDRGFSCDIPAGKVGAVRLAPAKRLKKIAQKAKKKRSGKSTSIEPGVYPFSLYCKEHGNFAVGNSPPELIIDEGP